MSIELLPLKLAVQNHRFLIPGEAGDRPFFNVKRALFVVPRHGGDLHISYCYGRVIRENDIR
jgi:hypothetical protein